MENRLDEGKDGSRVVRRLQTAKAILIAKNNSDLERSCNTGHGKKQLNLQNRRKKLARSNEVLKGKGRRGRS